MAILSQLETSGALKGTSLVLAVNTHAHFLRRDCGSFGHRA
jgi:hypothetical protein